MAKEAREKRKKAEGRKCWKILIAAGRGKSWHSASLLAPAVTATVTYLGGAVLEGVVMGGVEAAAGSTDRHVTSQC
jgi:hypothetical protein